MAQGPAKSAPRHTDPPQFGLHSSGSNTSRQSKGDVLSRMVALSLDADVLRNWVARYPPRSAQQPQSVTPKDEKRWRADGEDTKCFLGWCISKMQLLLNPSLHGLFGREAMSNVSVTTAVNSGSMALRSTTENRTSGGAALVLFSGMMVAELSFLATSPLVRCLQQPPCSRRPVTRPPAP